MLYPHVDDVELFIGLMMETTIEGPGETVKAIIRDGFLRARDGYYYWWENFFKHK